MKKLLHKGVALLAVVSMCTLSACNDNAAPPAQEPEVSEIEEIIEEIEEIEEELSGPVSLLTNEITESDVSHNRPLAVMIENTKPALPHYGLANAGIIYEIPAEGGINRYMALFDEYEDFERLGNVRSTRAYYIYVASEYDAMLAHIGQSTEAAGILSTGIVDDIDGMSGTKAFFRSSDKKIPHNAYIDSEELLKEIDRKGYDRLYPDDYEGHFIFSEEENLLPEGKEATTLRLYYPNNKPWFEYDEESQTYLRYAFGGLEEDALSDDGIRVTNIIFQDVNSKVLDNEGHLSVTLTGKGTGKFFTRGRMVDITWEKESNTARTVYYMPDGEEIELNTGKTFICLTENSQKSKNVIEPADEDADQE